ncbi:MAG: ECF transporter S component [Thermoproteota archaeon]
MKIHKLAIISTLTALCIATNYALIGVPNVKPMDFIVFVGGFCFGPIVGSSVGILSWAVYGSINPYGSTPPVFFATMLGESIYGLMGGFLGKKLSSTDFDVKESRFNITFLFGVVAFISTTIYDLITNVVYSLTYGIPLLAAIILGTPFTILHQLSNTAIFVIGSFPVIIAIEKSLGGEKFGCFTK